MKKDVLQETEKYNKIRQRRKRWYKAVACLACVVVFCTVYALILPAITLEKKECQLKEHTHTDACYTQVTSYEKKVLDCTAERLHIHQHTSACYDAGGNLICGLANYPAHHHDASCYDENENLWCELPEIEEHIHSDSCYADAEPAEVHTHTDACYTMEQGEQICGKEETEGHSHGEDCYTEVSSLICTLPENEEHTHGAECYETIRELTCPLAEEPAHHHTDECYAWDRVLTCGQTEEVPQIAGRVLICKKLEAVEHVHSSACFKTIEVPADTETLTCTLPENEEHQHTARCYGTWELTCPLEEHTHSKECQGTGADFEADVETAEDWEQTLAGVTLIGDYRQDVLAIAESQIGYTASEKNYIIDENGKKKRLSRYGQWYGDPYGDWCAMFASFCLSYGGVEGMPLEASCRRWIDALSDPNYDLFYQPGLYADGIFDEDGSGYEPMPGDLVFFDYENDGIADHVGLVYELCGSFADGSAELKTIERAGNQVGMRSYSLPNTAITGFGSLPSLEKEEGVPSLTDDSAFLSELKVTDITIEASKENKDESGNVPVKSDDVLESEEVSEDMSEDSDTFITARNGDWIFYGFSAETLSYEDQSFSDGRVKVEFVLPFTEDEAVFDLSKMSWLDNSEGYEPVITKETRLLNDTSRFCQVLTGYKRLETGGNADCAVPGNFSEYVAVRLLDMLHGERISLQISAAMEYGTWEGICSEHETEEKLTIATDTVLTDNRYSEAEQRALYEAFLQEVEELEDCDELNDEMRSRAEELLLRLEEAYRQGKLSDEYYTELYERVYRMLYGDPNAVAEAADGTNWILLRDSGWFEEYSGYASKEVIPVQSMRAAAMRTAADAGDESGGTAPSDKQIVAPGGSKTSEDGSVTVSKTISGTDVENVFDITLQVQTSMKVDEICQEPDMAVIIVMDISNTMNSNFGGVTRYAAAMIAAEQFLDQFAEQSSLGISKVGYVAFNTDAHEIFDLQPCSNQEQANALKNTMRTQTGNIINSSGYANSHSRFTNVEAGLAMANDMLNKVSNNNKYIIFLSDGFPTTYISSGYNGYDPYDVTGTRFHDRVLNKPCSLGTSYSDEAAIRARKKAEEIKSSGSTIFSIGVDVAGQTIQKYITQSENADGYSVVDRTGTTYEIGDANSTEAYKIWLRNSIGSGYYYDSTDSSGLKNAYDQIFTEIKHQVEAGTVADWVAEDPLPTVGGSTETVEFISFYNKNRRLAFTNLTGQHTSGGENTASFNNSSSKINWDLKASGYTETNNGTITLYSYQLVYRVRLKNEILDFAEKTSYPTNDTTTLQYRTVEGTEGNYKISDPKTIEFPIPVVKGYLSELAFKKTSSLGGTVEGAEFTLKHDTENCSICRGDDKNSVTIADQKAISGSDGNVSFENIPSGHKYVLEETHVPDGYSANGDTYQVIVAYDRLTVKVTSSDGIVKNWDNIIVNTTYYELPQTGGSGEDWYMIGGLLLMAAAGVLLLYKYVRDRREGNASS